MLNLFKNYPYTKKFYITHPHEFIKQTYRNFKSVIFRGIYGYCPRDVINLDDFFLELITESLQYFIDNHNTYPYTLGFDNDQEWCDYLKEEIIEPLKLAQRDERIEQEFSTELEFYNFKESQLEYGLQNLSKVLYCLWT